VDLEVPRSSRGGGTSYFKYLALIVTAPASHTLRLGSIWEARAGDLPGEGGRKRPVAGRGSWQAEVFAGRTPSPK
jgi:hypothetical protein